MREFSTTGLPGGRGTRIVLALQSLSASTIHPGARRKRWGAMPKPASSRVPEVWTEQTGRIITIAASGELDIGSIVQLAGPTRSALQSRPEKLVIDLKQVEFLDSQVLAFLVGAAREAEEQGTALRVRAPAGPAHRIFEIAGVLGADGNLSGEWIRLDGGRDA